jgi:hypothetical protein
MTQFKNIALNIFLSFILILIIFFLFKSGIIKNYIVGGPLKDFFIDFKNGFIGYLECYKLDLNFEVIQKIKGEVCPPLEYGKLILLMPYNQSLKLFYLNYLPYITIILFVFTAIFLLNPKNKLEYFIVTLVILNPSTLLQIERFNNDIFIFFILIIIALNRIYIFNWLLFYYCVLFKLYPIVSGSFIFIENKNRSAVFLLILVAFLGVVSLYFLLNGYFSFLSDIKSGNISKPGYWHLFTLNTIPKVLKYFGLNYIYCLIFVYLAFFYMTYKVYISQKINSLINNQDFFTFRWRLFLLGGNILLFCFIFFSNYTNREIFLILLIPQFLFLNIKKNKFSSLIIYFLIFRYLFLFIYGPSNVIGSTYYIDDKRYFSYVFLTATFVKGLLDFLLMALIGSILIKINYLVLKRFILKLRFYND